MKRLVQAAAEDDILRQLKWYVDQSRPDIARRFRAAVTEALNALVAMPAAGPPRQIANSALAGLRTWPIKGFGQQRIYYLLQPDETIVLRILHDKRDTGSILQRQTIEDAGSQ